MPAGLKAPRYTDLQNAIAERPSVTRLKAVYAEPKTDARVFVLRVQRVLRAVVLA